MRKLAMIVTGVIAVWIVVLVVLGFALAGRTGDKVAGRLAESLHGTATVGDASLTVLRGRLELDRLAVRRDDAVGRLALDVESVRCELPPLGLALVDRECRELVVDGVRLEVSTFALFKLQRPKRKLFRVRQVVVEDATFVFSPSALLPSLGRVQLTVEHAAAGPTTFKTPLSFLFSLRELRAAIDLPAGLTMRLTYAGGVLAASGSLFGSTPLELPVTLPVANSADDAQTEMQRLVAFGRDLAERIVAQRAKDWIKSKL